MLLTAVTVAICHYRSLKNKVLSSSSIKHPYCISIIYVHRWVVAATGLLTCTWLGRHVLGLSILATPYVHSVILHTTRAVLVFLSSAPVTRKKGKGMSHSGNVNWMHNWHGENMSRFSGIWRYYPYTVYRPRDVTHVTLNVYMCFACIARWHSRCVRNETRSRRAW